MTENEVLAQWRKENAYLWSIGKDPSKLTPAERKTLLFAFRYGSSRKPNLAEAKKAIEALLAPKRRR